MFANNSATAIINSTKVLLIKEAGCEMGGIEIAKVENITAGAKGTAKILANGATKEITPIL